MNRNQPTKDPKIIINRAWLILLAIIVVAIGKFYLGYWRILLFDILTLTILIALIIINFFISKTIVLYRILSFLILIYSMFGLMLPALEFTNIAYTIIASATYLLPLIVYMFIVKKVKKPII